MKKNLITLLTIHLALGITLLFPPSLPNSVPVTFPSIQDILPPFSSVPQDSLQTSYYQELSQWSDSTSPLIIYVPEKDTTVNPTLLTLQNQPLTKPLIFIENPQALYPFFEKLLSYHQGINNKPIHIAFYGDSQIEGDRLTHQLRFLLHQYWNGKGIGYVPFYEPATHYNIQERSWTPNWHYHSIFLKRAQTNRYGASGYLFYYTLSDTLPYAEISITLKPYAQFDHVLLSYGNLTQPLPYQLCFLDTCIHDTLLPAIDKAVFHRLPLPFGMKQFSLRFTHSPSPHFYGFYFNGNEGIIVDNYGIRGHAGQGWKYVDGNYLATQLRSLNTQLIILEYGGNAIPGIKVNDPDSLSEKDLSWFEQGFAQLLSYFQNHLPDIPILVIGVSDMAQVTANQVIPYASVPLIRNIQRRLALQHNCAFFDLLEAMGGQGSIIQWAHLNPPLAAQDYAHFSYYGQKTVATLLFNALHYEYMTYLKKHLP